MSDTLRPEIYVSPERLSALQALAFAGVTPVATAQGPTRQPLEAVFPARGFVDSLSDNPCPIKALNEDEPNSSNWRSFSICRGYSHLFFPPFHNVERPQEKMRRERNAKAMCALCPVKRLCLDAAIEKNEYGIWGGTAEEERQLGRRVI